MLREYISIERLDGWIYLPELGVFVAPEAHDILVAVRKELLDPDWAHRTHGSRKTYVVGCRGPLCTKAQRDYGRQYQRTTRGHTRVRMSALRAFDSLIHQVQQSLDKGELKVENGQIKTLQEVSK